eukprot:3197416-Amphidinium_carterae.1
MRHARLRVGNKDEAIDQDEKQAWRHAADDFIKGLVAEAEEKTEAEKKKNRGMSMQKLDRVAAYDVLHAVDWSLQCGT